MKAEWLNPSAVQLKLVLDGMPQNLSHFNLNMYFDDNIYFISLVKNPRIIEAIKLLDSKKLSNVWSLIAALEMHLGTPELSELLKYDEFTDDMKLLINQASDTRFFYSKEREAYVTSWRERFGRNTGTTYPDDFIKMKERYKDDL